MTVNFIRHLVIHVIHITCLNKLITLFYSNWVVQCFLDNEASVNHGALLEMYILNLRLYRDNERVTNKGPDMEAMNKDG